MVDPFKSKALTRLKRANGQLAGIFKMIETDKACADILTQILALQGALNGVKAQILESHLNTCGLEHLSSKDPKKRNKFIQEILKASSLSGR